MRAIVLTIGVKTTTAPVSRLANTIHTNPCRLSVGGTDSIVRTAVSAAAAAAMS